MVISSNHRRSEPEVLARRLEGASEKIVVRKRSSSLVVVVEALPSLKMMLSLSALLSSSLDVIRKLRMSRDPCVMLLWILRREMHLAYRHRKGDNQPSGIASVVMMEGQGRQDLH